MNNDIYVLIEHVRGQIADISYIMLAQANQLAPSTGGKVIALLLGQGAQGLASDLAADRVAYIDHPALAEFTGEATQRVLADILARETPRLVLMGDTTIGSDVAGMLSARLNLPLVSACRAIRVEAGCLAFTSQTCGGKMMADGVLPTGTTLVLMVPGGFKPDQGRAAKAPAVETLAAPDLGGLRVSLKQYNEPASEDVDITREAILVGVGRGIQREDNLELAQELAEALGGVVCATRPVVDQNWLPTTRLVGKSGKTVKPKVYIALGISGAPEHSESITGSEMIIAVNTDAAAPIFDMAKYGTTIDLLDLLPVLSEKVRQAKSG